MSSAAQITQRDLAKACQVHPSTICLALGNSPSIPAATRERIQAMAQKLGYQPNVAARNLAFLRADKKDSVPLPLAWINQEPQRNFWHTHAPARAYLESARQRAAEGGYYLEEFWAQEPGMRVARLVQILRTRGIQGVLFPLHRHWSEEIFAGDWEDFSAVAFNDHRAAQWMDVVCPDYYHGLDLVLRQLRSRGFGRIGLALSNEFDAATDGLVGCRYLRFQAELSADQRLPICALKGDWTEWSTRWSDWVQEQRPEVVVIHSVDTEDFPVQDLFAAKVLPVAQWGHPAAGSTVGLRGSEQATRVAKLAVDCLAEKIRRFERGVNLPTRRHLVTAFGQAEADLQVQAVA